MIETIADVHAEMCIAVQILTWAAVLVLLVRTNFIDAVRAQSTPNKFAISENDDSLALKDGRLNSVRISGTSAQIDGNRAAPPPSVRNVQRENLLRNELVRPESLYPAQRHVQDTALSKSQGKEAKEEYKSSRQTEKENGSLKLNEVGKGIADNVIQVSAVDGSSGAIDNSLPDDTNQFPPLSLTEVPKQSNSKGISEANNLVGQSATGKDISDMTGSEMSESSTHFQNSQNSRLYKRDTSHDNDWKQPKDVNNKHSYSNKSAKSLEYKTSPNNDIVSLDPKGKKGSSVRRTNPKDSLNSEDVSDGRSRQERQIKPEAVAAVSSRNIRARKEGDAMIGALFPLHHTPNQTTAYTRQCGVIREYYGIQRVEAFLMTIDKINNDDSILPNITLGWDIRDSCWYSPIALENSIDFIKDAIASQAKSDIAAEDLAEEVMVHGAGVSSTAPLSLSSSANGSRVSLCRDNKYHRPIAGLVGPGSSESTIQVQNLLQIFNIPQIGYSATSMDLSDKSHYKYFLRVVPPDKYQARALVDIVVKFNWTYISIVHSDGNYGNRGMEKFTDLAREQGVCIATSDNVASRADDAAFDAVLDNLLKTENASVVVCFCEGITVQKLFKATRRRNMEGRFLFIGSDGWGNRLDVVRGQESAAVGGISIKLYSPPLSDFGAHYSKLKPHNSLYNPWIIEFWEYKFNCSLDKDDMKGYSKFCTGNESLADSDQDSKLGFVVTAVTTMAKALHNMHQDVCPGSAGLCPAMDPINGSIYLQYLLNVSFKSYSGEMVHFDSQGDPPGRYEILNYQPQVGPDGNITYKYVTIGHWMTGTLTLDEDKKLFWPKGRPSVVGVDGMFKSVCSEPCKWGQAKKVRGVACCWICTTCIENQILVDNNTDCRQCDQGMWPNLNKTDCEEIPIDFINWSTSEAIVCITLGCIGICVTLWISAIFIRYNDTPIVKASTRELSYIILVGICLAFSANFFIVAKPTKGFCYLTRILPGLSFSLMYGALVTRTNRIARILEGSKRIMTKKPRFMSATAQVVITGIIIGIECAVITGMLIYQPADSKLDYPAPRKVRLICDTSTLGIVVPLGFDLVLILLCTIYAVKTRNLPENFNEAKFIGFTMYSTCVIWLGFFPIYFGGENKEITLSISVSLSAAIALILLFMPKVYVIVWVPQKNTRGAFTTSRDVRCHIGSKSMASGDSIDIRESSTCDNLFKSEKSQGKNWRQKSLDEKRLRFVMQRSAGGDNASPYINHGVLANHSSLRSAGFVERDSKDSSKTELTPVSTLTRPDKEKMAAAENKEQLSGVEVIRQNLARDYPLHKRQPPLRPGSPAEKEKHRIHNVDHLVDLDELLGLKSSSSHGRYGKPGDFRKSLSSTCVSSCPKTKSVQCQTSDELVHFALPPLRKRCLSKSKNRLERSGAVDDNAAARKPPQEVHVFKYPSPRHSKSLTNQNSPLSPPPFFDDPYVSPSETSPLVLCHNYEQQSVSYLPDQNIQESSFTLEKAHGDSCHRSHNHNPHSQRHPSSHRRHSNDGSSLLPSSDRRNSQSSKALAVTPSESSDFSFMDGIEDLENSVSPACQARRAAPCRATLPRNLPEPGVSPSSHSANGANWCHTNDNSLASLTQQDSCSSATISTASSSFTLPPFHTSTDSNPSQQTFSDSDDNIVEPEDSRNDPNVGSCARDGGRSSDKERTKDESRPQSKGHNTLTPSDKSGETPVVPLEDTETEEKDMLEFHKYLQGHGVKLDLASVKSSDL